MSINSELKREGIINPIPLDTLTINKIANSISEKIVTTFPDLGFNKKELFSSISRINMYFTNFSDNISKAKYFYKNKSIYLNSDLDINNIDNFVIHECIHYLQEVKDNNQNLIRLGLCDFGKFKIYGMSLNEAAVQLATSKILKNDLETVKYFDITLPTPSPLYYPLECALANQIAYLTGTYVFYHSTFFGSDLFKDKFISITDEHTYYTVQSAFDKLLSIEDSVGKITEQIASPNISDIKLMSLQNKATLKKETIRKLFINTQDLIFTSYFDKSFKKIKSLEDLENYRRKLYNLKDFLGFTSNYNYFNEYYLKQMDKLEKKYAQIENVSSTYLIPIKQNWLKKVFNFL